jgi:hypothetical protein
MSPYHVFCFGQNKNASLSKRVRECGEIAICNPFHTHVPFCSTTCFSLLYTEVLLLQPARCLKEALAQHATTRTRGTAAEQAGKPCPKGKEGLQLNEVLAK